MLNISKQIPFYEANRISSITVDDDKNFVVNRYDIDGKKTKKYFVNKKYINSLLDNYYEDLQGYLNYNNIKYEEYKNNNLKISDIDRKIKRFRLYKVIALILTLIPIIVVTLNPSLIFIITSEFVLIPSFFSVNLKIRKYEEMKDNKKFVVNYNNYLKEMEMYRKDNIKEFVPTIYSQVDLGKDANKIIDINKKKEKKVS